MPLLVTKNVVSADCARAGCAAIKQAARQKHTDEIILANLDIYSSEFLCELLFAICFCELVLICRLVDEPAWPDINPTRVTLFRSRNAAMKGLKIKGPKRKRRRGMNRGALYHHRVAKRSGLLDRREF